MNVHPIKAILTREPWNKPSETTQIHSRPQKTYLPLSPSNSVSLSTQHINWLWLELTGIYGHMFISKNGTNDSNGIWFKALKELTPKALESGVDRLNKLSAGDKFTTFPPNCLEFKALCLDFYSTLDLPKAKDAYLEIKNCAYSKNPRWSHPIVKLIAMRLPKDFLLFENEKVAYDHFKKAYDGVCNLVRQGHDIPEVNAQVMIEAASTKSIAQVQLQIMRQRLGA